jgi:F0F1-type ATP synthase delta subunit
VVTLADVGKLFRELEVVENKLLQLKMRKSNDPADLPALSKRLEHTAQLNKLNLLHESDLQTLKALLTTFKQKAPLMYISFSSEPTPDFLEKLIVWLRREINPNVLVSVGLQPTIGAGCVVRSTNKYFDLSLRQTFMSKRQLLLEQIIPPASETQETQVA